MAGYRSDPLLHPGGAKVLDTVQAVLGLSDDDLAYSRKVLRDFFEREAVSKS